MIKVASCNQLMSRPWQIVTYVTSKIKIPKSETSRVQNPTHMITVASWHQLIPLPWQIVTTAGPDSVAEDNMLTITQSISKNNISKSETSCLSKPNIYEQGSQLSPTHAPTLTYCYPVNLWKQRFQIQNITPFKHQHIWTRYPVATNSCPILGRLLWNQVLVLVGKLFASCTKQHLPNSYYLDFENP